MQLHTLRVSYSTAKTLVGTLPSYYLQQGEGEYDLFVVGSEVFVSSRVSDSVDIDDFETNHKAGCSSVASPDDALVLGLVANGVPLIQPRTLDGKPKVAQEKTSGTRVNFFSHNFCNKTTWYQMSTRVVDEVADDSGDHLTYALDNEFVIDTYHGKITFEDDLKDANGNSYRVAVKVNGVAKTEQDPHYGAGGDYTVNYAEGTVTFLSALDPADVVTVTYYYATTSRFTVKANPGSALLIDLAEAQFSLDVELKDSVVFEVWAIADYFIPAYVMALLGIPTGVGYMVRLQRNAYKTMGDFYNDTFKSYPLYKAIGPVDSWRSQKADVTILEWDYLSSVTLYGSKGMEIRVILEHDEPFIGYLATASFYCLVNPE